MRNTQSQVRRCRGLLPNFPCHSMCSYLVGFVQDDSDLVVLSFQSFDGLRELIRDVQFVSIEQQDDPVHPLPEPAQDLSEVIT